MLTRYLSSFSSHTFAHTLLTRTGTRVHTPLSPGTGGAHRGGLSPTSSAPESQSGPALPRPAPPPHAYAASRPSGPAPRRPFVAALEAAFGRRCEVVWRSAPPGRRSPSPLRSPSFSVLRAGPDQPRRRGAVLTGPPACFCIHSASLCLLFGAFNPFTFKVIIDKYHPNAIYFIVLGSNLYTLFVFPV